MFLLLKSASFELNTDCIVCIKLSHCIDIKRIHLATRHIIQRITRAVKSHIY